MVRRSAAAFLVAVGCVLALALTGCSRSSGATAAAAVRSDAEPTYTLMQMNLCLSGLAGCHRKVQYPGVVNEAIARIRAARPDAVTFNEACSGDVALIARRTDYHWRFSTVIYYGKPLACIRPGGRGLFGDAVLIRAAVDSSESHAFRAQAGPEQRRWLCVDTRPGVDVCTAHRLARARRGGRKRPAVRRAQIVARASAASGTVIFGGDLNHRSACAPNGFWIRPTGQPVRTPAVSTSTEPPRSDRPRGR